MLARKALLPLEQLHQPSFVIGLFFFSSEKGYLELFGFEPDSS
jgi:hypothetical protein